MKKLSLLLLAATIVFSFSACGSSDSKDTKDSETDAATTDTKEDEASSSDTASDSKEDTIQGVSNDYYSLTVDNVTWDDTNVTIEVTYTNNDTLPAVFDFEVVDINGCRWYGGAYSEVEAGATVSATAEMRQDSNNIFDSTEAYAYVQPDEITIYPDILNDDGDYDKSLTTPFSIYPTGLTPDTVEYPSYTPKDTDIVIIDEEDVKVIITSINPDAFKDCYYLYIQNDSDIRINCLLNDETYQENGESCNSSFGWIDVYPGERVSSIIYMHGDDVQSLAGTFIVSDYDQDMWGENPLYTGDFSITVADYDDGE